VGNKEFLKLIVHGDASLTEDMFQRFLLMEFYTSPKYYKDGVDLMGMILGGGEL